MAVEEQRKLLFPLKLMLACRILAYPSLFEKYLQLKIWKKLLSRVHKRELFYFLQHKYYLSKHLTLRQRIEGAISHHEYETKNFSEDYIFRVYHEDGIKLWEHQIEDHHFWITLAASEDNRNEGDLTVLLVCDGNSVWDISFSYVNGFSLGFNRPESLFLTKNQAKYNGARRIFDKCFGQKHPQLFCLSAVCGVATANGWDSVLAIRHDQQIAYDEKLECGFSNSYTSLWKQFDAQEVNDHVYEMRAPLKLRPLSAVSPSHRGRARARRKFWDDISRSAHAKLASYRRCQGFGLLSRNRRVAEAIPNANRFSPTRPHPTAKRRRSARPQGRAVGATTPASNMA